MANNSKNNGKEIITGAAIGVAAATAAAAAAAAGAYWFYGSADAAKHRKSIRSFMLKARADVLEAVEKVKDIDKNAYLAIVDRVVAKYSTVAGVTSQEVVQMTRDLKAAWTHMKAVHDAARGVGAAKAAVKKIPAKKAPAKKAAKKSGQE